MTSAALPPPGTPDPLRAPSLRWGILGPGGIARSMAEALTEHTNQRITGVGSRSYGRAQAFANAFGGTAYGSYDDLVAAQDVDIVYVATPHSEHHEHARLAIGAGKHVLVEKAFTVSAGQAHEVIEAARAAGVFLMEAMWSRHLPSWSVVREAVGSGLLGDLATIHTEHGQLLWPDGPERMRDPALAAGALLDLGVYSLALPAMLLPQISSMAATGTLTDRGVDLGEAMTLLGTPLEGAGAGPVIATATAHMGAQGTNAAMVAGTRARLELAPWFFQPGPVRLVGPDDQVLDTFEPADPSGGRRGLHFQACEAARCIADGQVQSPVMPWAETLRVMDLMDEVRRQLGVHYPGE